jgi:hypothetical protein
MCCLIETPELSMLFDAGVSLGLRFGLAPHPREYLALAEARKRIRNFAQKAEVIVISHYHFDHFTPPFKSDTVWTWATKEEAVSIYSDKVVLAKDMRENINYSQRKRGWIFKSLIGPIAKNIEEADRRTFRFGKTELRFSPPLGHGEDEGELGYVLAVTVTHGGESITIAPDIQGTASGDSLIYVERCKSGSVFLGGPPTYLAQWRGQEEALERSIQGMASIASATPLTIIDHHLLRDIEWRRKVSVVFQKAKMNSNCVKTAAEHLGSADNLLEASRKRLYETEPPTEEFLSWTRMPLGKRRRIPPPI